MGNDGRSKENFRRQIKKIRQVRSGFGNQRGGGGDLDSVQMLVAVSSAPGVPFNSCLVTGETCRWQLLAGVRKNEKTVAEMVKADGDFHSSDGMLSFFFFFFSYVDTR